MNQSAAAGARTKQREEPAQHQRAGPGAGGEQVGKMLLAQKALKESKRAELESDAKLGKKEGPLAESLVAKSDAKLSGLGDDDMGALGPYEGDQAVNEPQRGYWPYGPQYTRFNALYRYWMLPHCLYVLCFYLLRVAFENDRPTSWRVVADFWLDFVYLIDMVRIFTSPYTNEHGKMVYNKKLIALRYLKTWFFFDLFAFYPLGWLRYNSDGKEGSPNDAWENFSQQNYQRMPIFYKVLLLAQVTRARFTFDYFDFWLRNLSIRPQT